MKKILFFMLLLYTSSTIACDCISIEPINTELSKGYDVIFAGEVDSVGACNEKGIATAYFTIQELYKGNSKRQLSVHFDCSTSCLMSFAGGETWLIYGNYQHFDEVVVNLCGHSRKRMKTGEQDFYLASAKRTFEEEKTFLKTNIGIQPFIQDENWNKNQDDLKPRNEQPGSMRKVYLLLASFGVMILLYIITRKNKRKNG